MRTLLYIESIGTSMTQALKHLLPPTREQLANVRGMEEFIRSICEYITPNNPMSEPNNVAIMYRAFLEAMRYEGLSCPQDEAKLTFVFRGQRYLVRGRLQLRYGSYHILMSILEFA